MSEETTPTESSTPQPPAQPRVIELRQGFLNTLSDIAIDHPPLRSALLGVAEGAGVNDGAGFRFRILAAELIVAAPRDSVVIDATGD